MQTLNGPWWIAADPRNIGRDAHWFERTHPEARPAPVPGVIQQVYPGYHGVAWYWHSFHAAAAVPGERRLLHFGAVDAVGEVWLNGRYFGCYEGAEIPIEVDVTEALAGGENLLAVRVLNPTDEPIDGYVLRELPSRNRSNRFRPGQSYNQGGIPYPVILRCVPAVYVADLTVRPDPHTGEIAVLIRVRNTRGQAASGTLRVLVCPAVGGSSQHTDVIAEIAAAANLPEGDFEHALSIVVPQPRYWDLDDPYLYRVTVTLATDDGATHTQDTCCGFRDFRIVDGFFHLNGRRIFLKSTHTGNAIPIGQQTPVIADFVRRDLVYAKAAGFNAVRFIAGVAYPEQLDFCDEIGLLVWESTLAGWLLRDSPQMTERFDRNTLGMLRRDRNHPSLAIWELLNETNDGPVFRHAVTVLPRLRELDPTRLVLLSSGRWDGDWRIGSASNPGSAQWEPVWGVEGPDATRPAVIDGLGNAGYVENAGDAHYYPRAPQSPRENARLRTLGRGTKPVLLSEYGMGSLFNVTDELRCFQQAKLAGGASGWTEVELEDAAMVRQQAEWLEADWLRLGFDGVYPFAEDLLAESGRLHARQRTLGFNLIRANPQLCGYNLTGMLDHGMCGEGLWSLWREWKAATFDAVRDGWAPLRWCLFVDPPHGVSGGAFTVEGVLANEGALPPGEYAARFRIVGPTGVMWERSARLRIPAEPVFAVTVLRETVRLDGPAGQYTFAAALESGGYAWGGREPFYVSAPTTTRLDGAGEIFGIDAAVREWLEGRGFRCDEFGAGAGRGLIFVGHPAAPDAEPASWAALLDRIERGATALFLSVAPFRDNQAAFAWLPVEPKGRCYAFNDWLYHKECVAKRHAVFEGLAAPGIMDWDYYGPVIPREIFAGIATPDETVAAAFATGHHLSPDGYECGILVAAYRVGAGRLILNTLRVLDNLKAHPAAERLLANLVAWAQACKTKEGV